MGVLTCSQLAWAATAGTTTTLTVTSGGGAVTTVTSGSVVTLTAKVKAGVKAITVGQVDFCDAAAKYCTDIHLLGTAQLGNTGAASLRLRPGIGNHSYKAVFVGTRSSAASVSGAWALAVTGKNPTWTSMTASGVDGIYTVTATVAGEGPASPTGSVSFVDTSNGNALLGAAALGQGEATLNWFNSQAIAATSSALSVVAGDFNGDGIPDLAMANNDSLGPAPSYGTITVLLGIGDGTFAAAPSPHTGVGPISLAVGDFNQDGNQDLAVVNGWTLTILLGNGDGTFKAAAATPSTGSNPSALAVGDFNGDGIPDLAIANRYPTQVTILLGNGDGTFTTVPAAPATDSDPVSIAVADFNGDGKLDLAVVCNNNFAGVLPYGTVTILLGKGDGTFTATSASVQTASGPYAMTVADFNGDGIPDLAVNSGTVLLGNGDGSFRKAQDVPASQVLAVGDFNRDGEMDLALVSDFNAYFPGTVSILLGDGDGTFTAAAVSPAIGIQPASIAAGDFNGDGATDLAVLNPGSATLTLLLATNQSATTADSAVLLGTPGLHQVAASYGGDRNNQASLSGATGLPGPPPATTTTLRVTSAGKPVTTVSSRSVAMLTATVSAGAAPVTAGQVNFCDAAATYCTDIHLLGTAQLTSAGTAALKLRPTTGSHRYRAVYVGTNGGAGSASNSVPLTVTGKLPAATTVAAFGSLGNYTFTATVAGAGPIAPTGSVSFLDTGNGNTLLATAALVPGPTGLGFLNSQALGPPVFPTGAIISSPAMGDFNGDGIPDLAVTNYTDLDGSGTVTTLLGNGDGTFRTASASAPTGPGPGNIAVGDFNGDGVLDLAVVCGRNNTLTILLGKGDGTFKSAGSPIQMEWGPMAIATADFNGDGKLDLAVTIGSNSTVMVLLGHGDGTFTPLAASPGTASGPLAMVAGDFNGDGILDLAVTGADAAGYGTVTILLGRGDGTFTAASNVPTAANSRAIVIADFNGDGKLDLAVVSIGPVICRQGYLQIFLGNGDGTFTAAPGDLRTDDGPISMVVGDFNGDGKPDLAVANMYLDNDLNVYLGKGDGTFIQMAVSPPAGDSPGYMASGDFNGDGTTDLAVTNGGNSMVTILLAQSGLSTATASGILVPGSGLHLADASYSGDGSYGAGISPTTGIYGAPIATNTVMAVTSGGVPVTSVANGAVVTLTATVKVGSTAVTAGEVSFCDAAASHCTDVHLLGTGQLTAKGTAVLRLAPGAGSHAYKAVFLGTDGAAASASSAVALTVNLPAPDRHPTATGIALAGTPGKYSLTATVKGQGPVAPSGAVSFLDTSNGNSVLGKATLVAGPPLPSWTNPQTARTGNEPDSVAVADFNGNGIPDLAVANQDDSALTILLGNGDGTFKPPAASPALYAGAYFVTAGDFNGDGIPDLAVAIYTNNELTILLGKGDGTFTSSSLYNESPTPLGGPISIAVGDFNRDGISDLAIANWGANNVTILLGNGDGTFRGTAASPSTGWYPRSIATGDFNGDGIPDLAVANNGSNTVTVLLGNGDGTFRTSAANPATGSNPFSIAVGDFNGDGNADLAVVNGGGNSVTILLGNGDGTFAPSTQSPATGASPTSVTVGDFNGDGKPDLAITNYSSNSLTILLGNGDGTFTVSTMSPATGNSPEAAAAANFGSNGMAGLAVLNLNDNTVSVLIPQLAQTATATLAGVSLAGAGTHRLQASYPGDKSFAPSLSTPLTLTVQTTPAITWATPSAIVFGTALSGVQLNATASVAGMFSYSPKAGAVLPAGQQKLTVTFNPADAIDYTAASASVTLAVNQATPAITWPSPSAITYGTPLGAKQLNASLNVAGTCLYTPGKGTVLPAGAQKLTANCRPADATDYKAASASVTFMVNPALLTVTASSPSVTYGASAPTITPSYSGFVSGDTAASLSKAPACDTVYTVISKVGSNPATACSGATASNYIIKYIAGSVTISKATPTIVWSKPAAITYGTALGAVQLNASSKTPGAFTYLPTAGTVLTPGTHTLSANFKPTDNTDYTGGAATVQLSVNRAAPAIKLTASASTVAFGKLAIFTATLTGAGNYPTGTVAFLDGAAQIGTGTLSGGSAAYATSKLAVGKHTLIAGYLGDENYGQAMSPSVTITVTAQ